MRLGLGEQWRLSPNEPPHYLCSREPFSLSELIKRVQSPRLSFV